MATKMLQMELGSFEDNMAAFEVALMLIRNGREAEAQDLLREIREAIEGRGEPKCVRALLPFVKRAMEPSKVRPSKPAAPCADGSCAYQRANWEEKALRAVVGFLFATELGMVVIVVLAEIAHRVW